MKPAVLRSVIFRLKALLCIALVLNLQFITAGCGNELTALGNGQIRIELTEDHALSQALEGTGFAGATAVEIDPTAKSARLIYPDANKNLTVHYALANGQWTITEVSLNRFGRTLDMRLNTSKHVTSMSTDDGYHWQRPSHWANAAPSSSGVQAYVDANQELLEIARQTDAEAGFSSPGMTTSLPGGGQAVVGGALDMNVKADSALNGPLLSIFTVLTGLLETSMGILLAIVGLFWIVSLIQETLLSGDPAPSETVPPVDEITDCDGNGIDDADDIIEGRALDCNENGIPDACEIANGDVQDCDQNSVPDACQTDTDGDGVIDPCDNCVYTPNAEQIDDDDNGIGDECERPIAIAATASQSWVYENITGATDNALGFSATVTDDPFPNTSYTYQWTITAPADRTSATFSEISGATSDQATFKAPERPAYSPSGSAYTVQVLATGDQFGNVGTATILIDVRVLGDVNGDGCVNRGDLTLLQAVEDGTETDPDLVAASDVNSDGSINSFDRQIASTVRMNGDGNGAGACP